MKGEFGKSPTVMSFVGNHLRVRRMDGSLVNSVISPYPTVLHGYTSASRWDDALRMCRFVRGLPSMGLCWSGGCIPSCGIAGDGTPMRRVEGYKEGVPATGESITDGLENMDCGAVQAVGRGVEAACASVEERYKGRHNSEAQQGTITLACLGNSKCFSNIMDNTLWACLAAMAVYGRELETAEEAYAAIDEVDKKIPIRAAQLAEMALLSGNVSEAENLLLQNGFVFRAIMTNLNLHNWNRQVSPVELDPEKINKKVELEYERERENG
uniref:IFT80/172/WDR35 TPR domain-containing protein n=1 Tax=Timema cristinae TaxID=61476 RepID=A0A7R9D265_TIMCR|nr:unnamed protein product [Timema cristinae]